MSNPDTLSTLIRIEMYVRYLLSMQEMLILIKLYFFID
ncbi:hypothetical protein GPUN_1626 [Glaciecola punicea ACAM 611]|uniref:Uncharacterized protein n=1 Tax=Glaciecola punicea ACAM 611 TaxID=1121923 RepID=H5TBR6_9ALTE|nr:hypothetical protein GPUN_1626 [Glaciecola punicea ACAM 611]